MPLVVPGINSEGGQNLEQEWASKLMGKTLADKHDEVSFAKKDLPEQHRVLKEGDMATMDHNPDRLNIHVDESNVVKKVTKG